MKARLSRLFTAIDAGVMRSAANALRLWLAPLLIAVALAATAWPLKHPGRVAQMGANRLAKPERIEALIYLGVAAGAVLFCYLLTIAVDRYRSGRWRGVGVVAQLNRLLFFVMAGPLVAWLATPKVEKSSPRLTLLFIVLAAAAWLPTLYALARPAPLDGAVLPDEGQRRAKGWSERLGRYLAPLLVLVIAVAYGWWFSRLSITNHHAFTTRTTDLGYYDNIFYQSIHGRPLGCTFIKTGNHASAHFDPILVVLSPLYLLYPRAELLLVLQSVWLGLGVIPSYLLGRLKLGTRRAGIVLAIVYAIYPALHGANMYEFHSLTLFAMPAMWALYFMEAQHGKRYLLTLLLLLLVREDVALVMCFVGGYGVLTRRAKLVRLGWLTVVISLAYFVVIKTVFMTSADLFMAGKNSYSFAYYYRDLIPKGESFGGFITTLVTNPAFVLDVVFRQAKLQFAAMLLVPLLLLPLLARPGRFMLLYGAIFLMFATRKPVYSPHFQYSVVAFPMMIALLPEALRRIRDAGSAYRFGHDGGRASTALLGCVLVASLLSSWKFGGIFDNTSFRGGFSRVVRHLNADQTKRYAKISALIATIEPGASVAVTNQMGAHLSNRKEVYFYRQGKRTHYAFVQERELRGRQRSWHRRRIARHELELVGGYKSMKLYRVHPENEKAPVPESAKRKKRGAHGRKNKLNLAVPDRAEKFEWRARGRRGRRGAPVPSSIGDGEDLDRQLREERARHPDGR